MTRIVSALVVSVLLSATLAAQAGAPLPAGFSAQFIDRTADACTDFYQFACGNWLKTHPLPGDRSRFGRMHELADRNEMIVRSILERAAARTAGRSANEQKIGDYYASCMDERTINARGAQPVVALLREIDALTTSAQLVQMDARFNRMGLPAFLNLGSAPDARDSSTFIATIAEGSLGLPDRELYLRDDARSTTLRMEYSAHVQKMFELLGEPPAQAAGTTRAIVAAETMIARANYDRVTLRDPRKRTNPTTLGELATLAPGIDVDAFLRGTGAPLPIARFNVINPQFVRELDAALRALPLSTWKSYMKWRLLSSVAADLSKPFEEERFRFTGGVLSGQKEMQPRWKRCSTAVAGTFGDDQLGEIVGQIFIQENFGADAKSRMNELIAALEGSLQRNIEALDWMGPATRAKALEKLKAMNHKIGSTEKWRDFSGLMIERGDFLGNVLRVSEADAQRQLGWIGTKLDPGLWLMTPQTVNAYYSPPQNEIVFPAGILQPPYFDVTKDDAVNFGAIGAVIGHELTHGFDDQGRKFDAKGNLAEWWTPADDTAFKERAACVVQQYSAYPAIGETRLNGALTLGENVADNGGVRIAYYALMEVLAKKPLQPAIDGFTPQQRFFLAWAQVWCENASDQDFQRRAQEDSHASGRWRANGVLRNSEEFRKAFGCQPGSAMAPANACRVW
jgi:putative endopeptidase